MSMPKEEAIKILQEKYDYCKSFYDLAAHPKEDYPGTLEYLQALQIAISALLPITREQVEKAWRGEWVHPHWANDVHCMDCKRCGKESYHRLFRGVCDYYLFCPHCGAPMTDEAVDMVMERLGAMKDGKGD